MRLFFLAGLCLAGLACGEAADGAGGATHASTSGDVTSADASTTDGASSVSASASTGTDAPLLRGLAWNIENFPMGAGAVEGVKEILAAESPDLIGVVEIGDTTAFTNLVAELGYEVVFNQDVDVQRIGIAYRPQVVELTELETLFVGSTYAFPRPAIKAHVRTIARPDVDFDLIVVHLKAQIDAESQARRRAACELIDSWIRDHVADGGDADVAVVGDMNDDLTDLPADNVFAPFLTEPERYRFLTLKAAQAGEFTYIPFERFIDHVLVTRDMDAEIGAGAIDVLEEDLTNPAYRNTISDHRPVAFTLDPR